MVVPMSVISLSYIVTTRNKLPYLKECVQSLLENVLPDEEIIVVDGASTDGSVEYLRELFNIGKIHQFLSEPDLCQAHGTNKAILLARGELIKLITDDDVYCYPEIRICKNFMLSHPDIDMLSGNIADSRFDRLSRVVIRSYAERNFLDWMEHKKRYFWFGDQGLLFRRDQLPLIGLLHTGVICIDVEMSVRITSQRQINLAWYSGIVALSTTNPHSNGVRLLNASEYYRINLDARRIMHFHGSAHTFNSIYESIKRRSLRLFKRLAGLKVPSYELIIDGGLQIGNEDKTFTIKESLSYCYKWLEWYNSLHKGEFMCIEKKINKRLLPDI